MDNGGNDFGNRPDGYPVDWDVLRRRVYARDGYRCNNCGAVGTEVHAHHIVPLSKGGANQLTNLTTLCTACHTLIHPHMQEPTYAAPWLREPVYETPWQRDAHPERGDTKADTYRKWRDAMIGIGIVLLILLFVALNAQYEEDHPRRPYCDEIPAEFQSGVDCVVR